MNLILICLKEKIQKTGIKKSPLKLRAFIIFLYDFIIDMYSSGLYYSLYINIYRALRLL